MSDTAATEPDVQEDPAPDEDATTDEASLAAATDALANAMAGDAAAALTDDEPHDDDDAASVPGNGQSAPLEDAAAGISALSVVEAILFASDAPLPAPKIARVVGTGGARDVRLHIKTLNERYAAQGAAYRIDEVAGGFRMLTLPDFHPWLSKLRQTRAMTKLSKAALETLAIVAYKQPCLRADIEAVRGVASGEVLNRLREMGLVKIVGRAEEVGRPMLYGTTRKFLEVFGLQQIEDLPAIEGLKPSA